MWKGPVWFGIKSYDLDLMVTPQPPRPGTFPSLPALPTQLWQLFWLLLPEKY